MPTYEYECPKCNHRFEKFQLMSDPPVRTCPRCRGRKVKRLIGAGAGLLFRGSGFYITDYRDSGYKEAAKREKDTASGKSGESKSADAKSPASNPAKPAATSGSKAPGKGKRAGGSGKGSSASGS